MSVDFEHTTDALPTDCAPEGSCLATVGRTSGEPVVSPSAFMPNGALPNGPPLLLPPFQHFTQWKVSSTKECPYISPDGWHMTLPGDFLTDLNSSRNAPVVGFLVKANGKDTVGAVFHDYGYRENPELVNVITGETRRLSKGEWDRIFYHLMLLSGKGPVRAWIIYRGVWLTGWPAWNEHRRAERGLN